MTNLKFRGVPLRAKKFLRRFFWQERKTHFIGPFKLYKSQKKLCKSKSVFFCAAVPHRDCVPGSRGPQLGAGPLGLGPDGPGLAQVRVQGAEGGGLRLRGGDGRGQGEVRRDRAGDFRWGTILKQIFVFRFKVFIVNRLLRKIFRGKMRGGKSRQCENDRKMENRGRLGIVWASTMFHVAHRIWPWRGRHSHDGFQWQLLLGH